MTRPWLDRDEQARAVALADVVQARLGRHFSSSPQPESAAFRAVHSLAVAEVMETGGESAGLIRGGRAVRFDASEAERVTAQADVQAAALAEARIAYDAELGAALDHARHLIETLGRARAIDSDVLGEALRDLVLDLVAHVVGAHVAADAGFVTARVEEALALLKTGQEPGRLSLNPADLALIETGARYPNLTLAADPSLPRGSLRLEACGAELVDGAELRLAQLREGLA